MGDPALPSRALGASSLLLNSVGGAIGLLRLLPVPPPPCRRGKWGHRWSFSRSGSSRLLHEGERSPEDGGASAPFALPRRGYLRPYLCPCAGSGGGPRARCPARQRPRPRPRPPATSSAKRSPGESGRSDRGGARGAGAGRRSDQGTGLTWGVQHLEEVGWRPTCRVETCITRCSPWSPASCTLQSRVPRPGWGLGVPGAAMLCVPGRRSL